MLFACSRRHGRIGNFAAKIKNGRTNVGEERGCKSVCESERERKIVRERKWGEGGPRGGGRKKMIGPGNGPRIENLRKPKGAPRWPEIAMMEDFNYVGP